MVPTYKVTIYCNASITKTKIILKKDNEKKEKKTIATVADLEYYPYESYSNKNE